MIEASSLFSASGVNLPSATKASNAKAAFIADQNKEKQEKSAALDNSAEIKTTESESGNLSYLQKNEQAKTQFLTQTLAQNESDKVDESKEKTAAETFLEYMEKTPEERYWEAFLVQNNMTQEQYDALPPEKQEKLLEKFKEFVKNKLEESEAKRQIKEKLNAVV